MSTKSRKVLDRSSSEVQKKKTVKELVLLENEGIIEQHETEAEEYWCKACAFVNSPYHSGQWHNCRTHLTRTTHIEAVKKYNNRNTISPSNQDLQENNVTKERVIKNQDQILTPIVKAELDLTYSQFILQKRLPFSLASSVHQLTQQISSKYSEKVLEEYKVGRKTITTATKSISETLKTELFEKLKRSPFSLSFDASSDVHGHTYLAVCARFIESDNYDRPTVKLITVLPITTSSTGETFYNLILKNVLIDEDIRGNLLGIATDDGKNMTGKDLGASSRLKAAFPHIFTFKDISHIFDNALKKGLLAIPTNIKEIITDIISHFTLSTQRSSLLMQTLQEMGMKPLEVLKLSKTRWLSWKNSTERILELWPGLKQYFTAHGNLTQKDYFSDENELCIRILFLLISNISDLTEYFQRDDLFYSEVLEKLKHSYVMLANIILKKEHKTQQFDALFQIPFNAKEKDIIKGKYDSSVIEKLVTGEEFGQNYLSRYDSIKELYSKVPRDRKSLMMSGAINFIYICLQKMRKKLPFNNSIMAMAQVIFFECEYDETKWIGLKDSFPTILKTKKQRDDYTTEIRKIEYNYNKIRQRMLQSMISISPLKIWQGEISNYPNIYLIAKAIAVLPYSSVQVERIFSAMKDIKNVKRNRLSIDNVEACLLGYQAFNNENIFFNEEIIEDYTNKKYVKK